MDILKKTFQIHDNCKIEYKYSKCRHYYSRVVAFGKIGVWERKLKKECVTSSFYVCVVEKSTGRAFLLNRNYKLIGNAGADDLKFAKSKVNNHQAWDGWCTTNESQKPAWAHNLSDSKFIAYWIKHR